MEPSSPEGPKFKVLSRINALKSRIIKPRTINEPPSVPTKELDTDDPESRELRIENQHTLESHLDQTFGFPFTERLAIIRNDLFLGFPHVRGHKAAELRNAGLARSPSINYASPEMAKNRFLPQFAELVDGLTEEIKNMDGDKAEVALNLASVIYSLGTPIHPYPDGNGQTLRLIALSYLQEISPDKFTQKYFPFKPKPGGKENTPATPILTVFTELRAGRFSDSEAKKEFALRGGMVDESLHAAREVTEEEMQEMFPTEAEKERIRQIFDERSALEDKLVDELRGNHITETSVNLFLDYILNSPEGKKFITDFVLHPNQVSGSDPENTPRYIKYTSKILTDIRAEIVGLLEPSDVHEQKFDEAKKLALVEPGANNLFTKEA